jgi:hypothetical protein
MDLEQLLIMYSRVVDAPKGSEEFSTAVRELPDAIAINDDATSSHTLPPPHPILIHTGRIVAAFVNWTTLATVGIGAT